MRGARSAFGAGAFGPCSLPGLPWHLLIIPEAASRLLPGTIIQQFISDPLSKEFKE